jgi:hypothetical protein
MTSIRLVACSDCLYRIVVDEAAPVAS